MKLETSQHSELRTVVERPEATSIDALSPLVALCTHETEAVETLSRYGSQLVSELGTGRVSDADLSEWIGRGDHIEQRDRYATVRTLELFTARAIDRDPLPFPDIELPYEERFVRRRVLQPTEIGLIRLTALYSGELHAASMAVLDAGGIAGEFPGLGPDQVFVIDADSENGLFLLGGTRHVAARKNQIPGWAFEMVIAASERAREREATLGDGHLADMYPSICTDSRMHHNKVQSAALMNVKTVMEATGLHQDPTVKPMSIRNTAGRNIYQTQGLEKAAAQLGVSNYNSLRREIGVAPHKKVRKKSVSKQSD